MLEGLFSGDEHAAERLHPFAQVAEGAIAVRTNWDSPDLAVEQHNGAGPPEEHHEEAQVSCADDASLTNVHEPALCLAIS